MTVPTSVIDETETMTLINERIGQLRELAPNHDLLRWSTSESRMAEGFADAFWDRPSNRAQAPLAVQRHNTLAAYSLQLKQAIERAKLQKR